MQTRSSILQIILVFLTLAPPSVWAQDGLWGAAQESADASGFRSSFMERLVAADFDNDRKLDGALLVDAGVISGRRMFRIELHVSASDNRTLLFASDDSSLTISAPDVNRDGVPDLVVEQAFTHKPLQVWLNDGHGSFRGAPVNDFPALAGTPWRWRAPITAQGSVVPGLPARLETDQAILRLQIIRFDCSSPHWRVRRDVAPLGEFIPPSRSPRAPPLRTLL